MRRLVIGDIHGGYKSLIQVLDRAGFDPKEDMLIGIGDYVDGWPESSKVIDYLMNLRNFKGVLGNHDCLSDDTELLTDSGWKKYNDVTLTDKILSLNTDTNTIHWDRINEIIIKEYSGDLNHLVNNHIDILITDKHRVLYKKRYYKNNEKEYGDYEYGNINDLTGRIKIPVSGVVKKNGISLLDNEIKFIAWVLTDGGIQNTDKKNRTNSYNIYQSKKNMVERIESLLKDLNYSYSLHKRNRNIKSICGRVLKKPSLEQCHFQILNESNKEIEKYFSNKYPFPSFLFDMNNEQFEIFLNEIILADGTFYKKGTDGTSVLNGTEEFLDNIQILCCQNGYRAVKIKDNRGDFKLNISKFNFSSFDIHNMVSKVKYDGKVWCLSVPETNFFVRRNGKGYFTGNCWAVDWMLGRYSERMWINQGGQATIDSYKGNILLQDVRKHGEWLSSLPYYLEIDNKLFIHGGCKNLSNVKSEFGWDIMWDRDLWGKIALKYAYPNKYKDVFSTDPYDEVYLGHTTTSRARPDLLPISIDNFHLIDQGGGWEGKLTLMDIDTHEFWQSDIVKDLYPDEKGR